MLKSRFELEVSKLRLFDYEIPVADVIWWFFFRFLRISQIRLLVKFRSIPLLIAWFDWLNFQLPYVVDLTNSVSEMGKNSNISLSKITKNSRDLSIYPRKHAKRPTKLWQISAKIEFHYFPCCLFCFSVKFCRNCCKWCFSTHFGNLQYIISGNCSA